MLMTCSEQLTICVSRIRSHFGSSHWLLVRLRWGGSAALKMAGGGAAKYEPARLTTALQEIYGADVPLREKRMLARHAVSRRMQAPEVQSPAPRPLEAMEEALVAVQHAAGFQSKPLIGAAKKYLRQAGQPALASRLGRLSKVRNGHAHPDVGLVSEILRNVKAGSSGGDDSSEPTDSGEALAETSSNDLETKGVSEYESSGTSEYNEQLEELLELAVVKEQTSERTKQVTAESAALTAATEPLLELEPLEGGLSSLRVEDLHEMKDLVLEVAKFARRMQVTDDAVSGGVIFECLFAERLRAVFALVSDGDDFE